MTAEVIFSESPTKTEEPLNYTGSPWRLLGADVELFFKNILYLPKIFLPVYPCPSGYLDELFPSLPNIFDISLHCILFVTQLGFLISLPLLLPLPVFTAAIYVSGFLFFNYIVCFLLNQDIPGTGLKSTEFEESEDWIPHNDEAWIFINGICVGKNWLQNNIDRISKTFHRPVVGVHNRTGGVVFDLVQCLIQRCLFFATSDIRCCYILVKKALYRPGINKVVLILHSQGGIEGGMIVDWLLNEVPYDTLRKLEVYTFGCLANHFNNPYRVDQAAKNVLQKHAIGHIEHYANKNDFASRWGVMHFVANPSTYGLKNRFMGTVFLNPRSGHQLNQHYLDSIFPLDAIRSKTRDPQPGDFMEQEVWNVRNTGATQSTMALQRLIDAAEHAAEVINLSPVTASRPNFHGEMDANGVSENDGHSSSKKVKELSRLWRYRNGRVPGQA